MHLLDIPFFFSLLALIPVFCFSFFLVVLHFLVLALSAFQFVFSHFCFYKLSFAAMNYPSKLVIPFFIFDFPTPFLPIFNPFIPQFFPVTFINEQTSFGVPASSSLCAVSIAISRGCCVPHPMTSPRGLVLAFEFPDSWPDLHSV